LRPSTPRALTASPLPSSVDAYKAYRQLAIELIEGRKRRIDGCSVRDR
jgi:hypothetical protein